MAEAGLLTAVGCRATLSLMTMGMLGVTGAEDGVEVTPTACSLSLSAYAVFWISLAGYSSRGSAPFGLLRKSGSVKRRPHRLIEPSRQPAIHCGSEQLGSCLDISSGECAGTSVLRDDPEDTSTEQSFRDPLWDCILQYLECTGTFSSRLRWSDGLIRLYASC